VANGAGKFGKARKTYIFKN